MAVLFFDLETDTASKSVYDFGAVDERNSRLHTKSVSDFQNFIYEGRYDYLCGHNIIDHDIHYLPDFFSELESVEFIDTLYLSALLFPEKPNHNLIKDDKISENEFSNPLNDAVKSRELFYEILSKYQELPESIQVIYHDLLWQSQYFHAFFQYCKKKHLISFDSFGSHIVKIYRPFYRLSLQERIQNAFYGKICENCNLSELINDYSVELAYCLASLLSANGIISRWVHFTFPEIHKVMKQLRSVHCKQGCKYCGSYLDAGSALKAIFHYDDFRTFNGGEPLQQMAVESAIKDESLLTIFPTGGGKSLTFQLPALIKGEVENGLTVVISPLQALMKDQVDNLEKQGIIGAVTINGMIDPIERSIAIERLQNGSAVMLYIAPESLRSRTIHEILMARNVVRVVIDEAHCFSAWGHDFRVDYQYIGKYLQKLCEKKGLSNPIPVSCFTATAKQKVISDIQEYFRETMNLELRLFATAEARKNLKYEVLYTETKDDKYARARDLIEKYDCPSIIYVSRTGLTEELAKHLTEDGIQAVPYHGKMDGETKIRNQDTFMGNECSVIVATSAFGMGVDKPDIGLVIHYDISESLENYMQESGRAGRDQHIDAKCFILFNEEDLGKHFMMLNQTKLSISDIQQVWSAIKNRTGKRKRLSISALELARAAGWDINIYDIETRVKSAINALENAGYIERGDNMPRVYATSLNVRNVQEAETKIQSIQLPMDYSVTDSKRIISRLLSSKYTHWERYADAESRVDYLADQLCMEKHKVIDYIYYMKEAGILKNDKDLIAHLGERKKTGALVNLRNIVLLEQYILKEIDPESGNINLKALSNQAEEDGLKKHPIEWIRSVLDLWGIMDYICKKIAYHMDDYNFELKSDWMDIQDQRIQCHDTARFIIVYLYDLAEASGTHMISFSVIEIMDAYNEQSLIQINIRQVEDAILFLSKMRILTLDGGFLVLYNSMCIDRIEKDNHIRYKQDDYRQLDEYYKNKIQQIHIVGEYARIMSRDYEMGLQFVSDYFQMDYKKFIKKYFDEKQQREITRSLTPAQYEKVIGELSETQLAVLNDQSRFIAVIAGPGSGKTRILVNKLASLLLLEDVKHEQLLMLTFSRAAANEFKDRLREKIGNAAYFVEINTFHAFALNLIGEIGSLDKLDRVVPKATEMILNGEVEPARITKTVIVIDEAQDMDRDEYQLVRALMKVNPGIRVIAVGDDDQNIYHFRGSDSAYLASLTEIEGAKRYEMIQNYRSSRVLVEVANAFAGTIEKRIKTHEIQAVKTDLGTADLTNVMYGYPEVSLTKAIERQKPKGSVCVLTNRNVEAAEITGLLNRMNLKAELIQSNENFDMYDIQELRYFLKKIKGSGPVIQNDIWDTAIEKMCSRYSRSKVLTYCLQLLDRFRQTSRKLYRSDLEVLIHESKLEDYFTDQEGVIQVSTIHKAKGREFDQVYMLLKNEIITSDEERRKLYVGMTRAKEQLHIFTDTDALLFLGKSGLKLYKDKNKYDPPEEIVVSLSHRDIYLDFFRNNTLKKKILKNLQSGDRLDIDGDSLYARIDNSRYEVLRFSKKFRNDRKKYEDEGYVPDHADVRFVLSWHAKDEKQEYALILPDIYFRRAF